MQTPPDSTGSNSGLKGRLTIPVIRHAELVSASIAPPALTCEQAEPQ
jgi:hypothetical protein